MEKIKWCKKQKKGIEVVEENNNLAKVYIKKAEKSLQATRQLKNNEEWEITASYYTIYFSIYAILMKIGIKSEIHSCTIEIAKKFLKEYFSKEELKTIELAKKIRIKIQYYHEEMNIKEYEKIKKEMINILIKSKEIVENITEKEIKNIREKIINI